MVTCALAPTRSSESVTAFDTLSQHAPECCSSVMHFISHVMSVPRLCSLEAARVNKPLDHVSGDSLRRQLPGQQVGPAHMRNESVIGCQALAHLPSQLLLHHIHTLPFCIWTMRRSEQKMRVPSRKTHLGAQVLYAVCNLAAHAGYVSGQSSMTTQAAMHCACALKMQYAAGKPCVHCMRCPTRGKHT